MRNSLEFFEEFIKDRRFSEAIYVRMSSNFFREKNSKKKSGIALIGSRIVVGVVAGLFNLTQAWTEIE